MYHHIRRIGIGITCLVLCTAPAQSAGIPQLNLTDLISHADLVVVGRLNRIESESAGTSNNCNARTTALSVDQVLKGPTSVSSLAVLFCVPHNPAGGNGYADVTAGRYSMFFLKRADDHYVFVSPYYPFFPAIPGITIEGKTVEERVLRQLASVLQSPTISAKAKESMLFSLQATQSAILVDALRNSLNTADRKLQLIVAAALLERNEVSAMNVAEDALINPPSNFPPYLLRNLSSAIERGIKDPTAVPALSAIARRATDIESRKAAMYALRRTNSRTALPALAHGLDDPDFEVRYYAVIGLADISGQPNWRPQLDQFREKEGLYLSHWQSWAQNQ
jgi:hypothetical protein